LLAIDTLDQRRPWHNQCFPHHYASVRLLRPVWATAAPLGPQVPYAPDYRHRVARVALVCIAAGHLRSTLRLAVRQRHAAAENTEHTPYHAQRVTCAFNATLPAYSGSTREHRTISLCSPGPRLAAGLCVQGKARPGPRDALASPSTAPPLSSDCASCFNKRRRREPAADTGPAIIVPCAGLHRLTRTRVECACAG
jgi:hypothetical protein